MNNIKLLKKFGPILLLLFILFNISLLLVLIQSRQDVRQRAAGGLVSARVLVYQHGTLLNGYQMGEYAARIGELISAASNGDINATVEVGSNVPINISSSDLDKLRKDPRYAAIKDNNALLGMMKYYDDQSGFIGAVYGIARGGYDFVFVVTNLQTSSMAGYFTTGIGGGVGGTSRSILNAIPVVKRGIPNNYPTHIAIIAPGIDYRNGTQVSVALFDRNAIAHTVIHEFGHARGANHTCNRCFADGPGADPQSDGKKLYSNNPKEVADALRAECCSKCQWSEDAMSYCHLGNQAVGDHESAIDTSRRFSACTIRRIESGYTSDKNPTECNEGTEEYAANANSVTCGEVFGANYKCTDANSCTGERIIDTGAASASCPKPLVCCKQEPKSCSDVKDNKAKCINTEGCFWYKGQYGQKPECRSGTAGDECGTESHCYAPDSTSNQVCYFQQYCSNKGALKIGESCENTDQCQPGSTCDDFTKQCTAVTPPKENACQPTSDLDFKCADRTSGGCNSLSGRWTESTNKTCDDGSQVCCWDMGPLNSTPSCGERFPGSACRDALKCESGYEIHDSSGTTCDDGSGFSICCGPKVDYGTEYNCLDKNCEAPTYTCVGSSNGNEVGSFCLVKGTGGPNAYCGLPDGKGANNDSCGSGYCNPATLRCATKPTSPPLPPAPPPPPTATPTPAAPAIPSVSAATCVNGDPGTLVFSWSREKSGYNYEIRWGTNYSESASFGDRSDSDPISGFSTNASLNYEVRSYLGNNIGPYKTGSVYIPSTCSTAGTSCTGGINNCANSDGSNYSCSGTKSYLGNGTMDSWCKNNGGAGSKEYCWKCTSTAPLVCDFNKNGSYDDGDISTWTTAYNTGNNTADCNGDGKSNIFDYNLWLEKSAQ